MDNTSLSSHKLADTDCTGGFFFLGVQRPGYEVNHSPPLSAGVKNEWSLTSAPPLCLRGVGKDSFTMNLIVAPCI